MNKVLREIAQVAHDVTQEIRAEIAAHGGPEAKSFLRQTFNAACDNGKLIWQGLRSLGGQVGTEMKAEIGDIKKYYADHKKQNSDTTPGA